MGCIGSRRRGSNQSNLKGLGPASEDASVNRNFIGIVGNLSSRKFTRALFNSFRKNSELPVIKLTVPLGGWLLPSVRLSDHASFWDKGFKAVMVTDSAFYRNPHYHLPSDTMDKLDSRFMAELVESLLIFFSSHHRPD